MPWLGWTPDERADLVCEVEVDRATMASNHERVVRTQFWMWTLVPIYGCLSAPSRLSTAKRTIAQYRQWVNASHIALTQRTLIIVSQPSTECLEQEWPRQVVSLKSITSIAVEPASGSTCFVPDVCATVVFHVRDHDSPLTLSGLADPHRFREDVLRLQKGRPRAADEATSTILAGHTQPAHRAQSSGREDITGHSVVVGSTRGDCGAATPAAGAVPALKLASAPRSEGCAEPQGPRGAPERAASHVDPAHASGAPSARGSPGAQALCSADRVRAASDAIAGFAATDAASERSLPAWETDVGASEDGLGYEAAEVWGNEYDESDELDDDEFAPDAEAILLDSEFPPRAGHSEAGMLPGATDARKSSIFHGSQDDDSLSRPVAEAASSEGSLTCIFEAQSALHSALAVTRKACTDPALSSHAHEIMKALQGLDRTLHTLSVTHAHMAEQRL